MNDEPYQPCEHQWNLQHGRVLGYAFEQEFEQEFEHLPFGADAGQEFERGIIGRQPIASVRRGGLQPRPTPGARPGQRSWQSRNSWPRPISHPSPSVGRIWPYGHVVAEPFYFFRPSHFRPSHFRLSPFLQPSLFLLRLPLFLLLLPLLLRHFRHRFSNRAGMAIQIPVRRGKRRRRCKIRWRVCQSGSVRAIWRWGRSSMRSATRAAPVRACI
jgi:hypothetical protein